MPDFTWIQWAAPARSVMGPGRNKSLAMLNHFWERVTRPTDVAACWVWTGGLTNYGYGSVSMRKPGSLKAHQVSWMLHNGPIPEGLCVLHRCDNPPCCNPAHLFLGTRLDNNRDRDAKGRNGFATKTHCPQGHEYAGTNLIVLARGRGRWCRTCQADAQRRYKARKRAGVTT